MAHCKYVNRTAIPCAGDSLGEYVVPVHLPDGSKYWLDAVHGNHWSRYMNHDAESPNIFLGPDASIRSLRDIKPQEELCFNYGDEYWPKTVNDRVHGEAMVVARGIKGWVVTYKDETKQWWLPDIRVVKTNPSSRE